jgi:hypothetical protein
MHNAITLTHEQLNALDQMIHDVRNGEISPDEVEQWAAAPVNNNNGGGIKTKQIVTGTLVTMTQIVTQVTLVTTILAQRVLPHMTPSEVAEIKKEATIEKLLEIRNQAIANHKK